MTHAVIELRHYSAALDEVYRLRRALQYEARVVEAHYELYKTFPKSRRAIAEKQVERMRTASSGHATLAYAGASSLSLEHAAREAIPLGLSRSQWEQNIDNQENNS